MLPAAGLWEFDALVRAGIEPHIVPGAGNDFQTSSSAR
jgi:hypothetical protein